MEDDFKLSEQAVSVLYKLQLLEEEVREIEKTTTYEFRDSVIHEYDIEITARILCEAGRKK